MGKIVDEIRQIRSNVSLLGYALAMGWEPDKVKSGGGVSVLHSGADKILVRMGRIGHEIFTAVGGDARGDVVDFACWVNRWTLQQAIQELSDANAKTKIFPSGHFKPSKTIEPDRKVVAAYWSRCKQGHGYLKRRGLDHSLREARFDGCFRQDERGNAVLPHVDLAGLCGLELRNVGFRGMLGGSTKALWVSRNIKTAPSTVITESPIDAMSHFELWGGDAAYASFSGTLSRFQEGLMAELLKKLVRRNCAVIVGTDNDEAGDQFYCQLQAMTGARIDRVQPVSKDWNEDLIQCRKEDV
jgi:hypothetical protein